MTRTLKNLGQAAYHGMLIRVTCRKCEKVANFTACDLAGVFGHGRPIESLQFRCRECNRTDCAIVPYEDDRDHPGKKRTVWRPVQM